MPMRTALKTVAPAFALLTTSAVAQDLPATLPSSLAQVSPALEAFAEDELFATVWQAEELRQRDRALITFAAAVTRHETGQIGSLAELALDAGVTPAELSETVMHLAFYTGWGNALAAAEAVAPVFDARGVSPDDLPAVDPDLLPLNEEAEANRQSTVQNMYGDTSQGVVDYTEDYLFRDLWLRPDLAPRDRSLVTVAGLIAGGNPGQVGFHLNRAMDNGLTQEEAGGVLAHLAFYAGWPNVFSTLPVAGDVFEQRSE